VTSTARSLASPVRGTPAETRLTAVVLARDEERDLDRCLRSLIWVDEILVIDDRSTDATASIAARYGRVLARPLERFDAQRNFALEQASHLWALFVDADEVVSDALAAEIRAELARPRAEAFAILRRNWFLGRPMRFGGWQGDWQVRLGRVERGRWSGSVHEAWRFEGQVGRLRARLDHFGDQTYSERLAKSNRYSSLVAERRFAAGQPVSSLRLLGRPAWVALKRYILKQGFRDGVPGLIWAGHTFASELAVEIKLWELRRGPQRELDPPC
jgi:glycosyltransferase involved in cell wall biosynthesis